MGTSPAPSGFPQQPEILPPEQRAEYRAVEQRVPGQPVPNRSRRSWAYAPATYILVGINIAVFLAMLLSGVSANEPTLGQLMHWGANNPTAVLYYGEWWRIFTAMFVHVGLIHLAGNMWCLWNLGLLGEPLIGPVGVFAAYILSGAAGNLLSIGINLAFPSGSVGGGPGLVGAGASGAVFGIAGVLIVLLKSPRLPIPPQDLKGLRKSVIYFAAINFVIGFGSLVVNSPVRIDNMAHLGGFLGGILFAVPMVPMLGSPRPLFFFRRRIAIGMMTSVLVFFAYYLSSVFPPSAWNVR
jgi:rhomboid protease GluP